MANRQEDLRSLSKLFICFFEKVGLGLASSFRTTLTLNRRSNELSLKLTQRIEGFRLVSFSWAVA